ncbi:MAG TPA: pitrilysin family protein [Thermosynechococcaceae cyanobacterium]
MLPFLRRYGLPSLLFSLCLVVILLVSPSKSQPPGEAEVDRASLAALPASGSDSLTQSVRKTLLDNGLTVLTKEVKTAPVVTVQVWYRVGSRNETAGINGIAHQLEHLMFKGTKERPIQFGRFFSVLGSESNAFTSYDQTAYFGTVEQDKLKAMLLLEADRMRNSIIGEKELESEKRVVISELQGYENSPNYRLDRAVMRSAFPDSPYGLPVGGTKADVSSFTVQQVRDYYNAFYRPDNATLVLVGNFETEPTLALVKETFGKVPAEKNPLPVDRRIPFSSSIPNTAPKPIVLKERGGAALLNAIFPLPAVGHPDVPALEVLDSILTGGRSSRIYQALVESGLASQANGYAANLIDAGWYDLSATAAPGKDLQTIDSVLQQTLAEVRDKGVTQEELDRAKTQFRASLVLQNRSITEQAMQLGDNQISTGDYRYTDRLLAAIEKVTIADVQRVAQLYLAPNRRTVGFFEPTQLDGKPGASADNFIPTPESFSPGAPVDPAEVAKYLPPAAKASPNSQTLPEKLTLANGLTVLLLPDRSTPTLTLSGYTRAGTSFDQPQTAGVASLTAANLMNGTKTKDALALAKTLEDRGASLEFAVNREGVTIGGEALAADLPTLVDILADVMQNASFPTEELELSRQRALTSLKLEADSPARLGRRIFQQTVYPENHPFHIFPTEASLKQIDRENVVQFYQQHYRPDTTILALVGDFDPAQVRNLLNQKLGQWQAKGDNPKITFPEVPLPAKTVRLNPTIPGKTQSVTYIGYRGIDRRDLRFYESLVLNQIVGGDTLSSRLGTEIRDRQGLTYGIYSTFQTGINPGPFLISMQTAPEDADRAITSALKLLGQLREQGVTPDEVAAAKRSITSSYPVGLADPDNLASTILMNAVYGLGVEEIRQFVQQIEAVTPERVNQAAKQLLQPDRVVVVTAGPTVSVSDKK